MNPEKEALLAQLLASLEGLSEEQTHDRVLQILSVLAKTLTRETLTELRAEIVASIDPSIPLVAHTLEMLDGQIALRELDNDWR